MVSKKARSLFSLMVIVVVVFLLAGCQKDSYQVSGVVVDHDGNPISGVTLLTTNLVSGEVTNLITIDSETGGWQTTISGETMITPHKQGYFFDTAEYIVQTQEENITFIGEKIPTLEDFYIGRSHNNQPGRLIVYPNINLNPPTNLDDRIIGWRLYVSDAIDGDYKPVNIDFAPRRTERFIVHPEIIKMPANETLYFRIKSITSDLKESLLSNHYVSFYYGGELPFESDVKEVESDQVILTWALPPDFEHDNSYFITPNIWKYDPFTEEYHMFYFRTAGIKRSPKQVTFNLSTPNSEKFEAGEYIWTVLLYKQERIDPNNIQSPAQSLFIYTSEGGSFAVK